MSVRLGGRRDLVPSPVAPYLLGRREPLQGVDAEHKTGGAGALQKLPQDLPLVLALQMLAPFLLREPQHLLQTAADEAHPRVLGETPRSPGRRHLLVFVLLFILHQARRLRAGARG